MNETTLYEWAGVAVILALVILYTLWFRKARKNMDAGYSEEEPELPNGETFEEASAEQELETEAENDAEPESPDKVFDSTASVAPAEGIGFEKADGAQTVQSTIRFEENLGKDRVVVEIPNPSKSSRKATKGEQPVKARPAPLVSSIAGRKLTPEELAADLRVKIERRERILKVAGITQDGDNILKRYRENLAALERSIEEQKVPAAIAVEATAEKPSKATKATLAKKPAKKKATPVKKPAKKKTVSTGKKPATKKAPAKKATPKKTTKKAAPK